jgi:hypothetical protein
MSDHKAAVTVAEMARMVGLSRQRFHQLIGTAFPYPIYSVETRRPFFNEELQQVCLEVRQRNFGVNGKPVLFYAKGHQVEQPVEAPRPVKRPAKLKPKGDCSEVLAAVRGLGLVTATADQVNAAMKIAFPDGVAGVDQGQVIRSVFLELKRQNRLGNEAR